MKRKIQNRSGFTLLEVLIATMISGIVLAAVMEVFASNYKSYILQDDIATMQENLRIGMSFLDRDVTMIGSGMPGVDKAGFFVMKIKDGNMSQERAYPLTFQNNAGDLPSGTVCGTVPGAGTGGSDRLIVRYNKFEEGPCGKERNDAGVLACDRLPQLTLISAKSANSSEADVEERIRYSNSCKEPYDPSVCACEDSNLGCYSLYPLWNDSCYCGETTYRAAQPKFFALITSPDGETSDIFVLTSVNAQDQLQNHPAFGLDNKMMNEYDPGSTISFFTMKTFKEVMYYLQDGNLRRRITTWPDPDSDSNPTCDDQPIVESIDDLQFAFGVDANLDGVVADSEWVTDRNLTDNETTQVRMVRINLLGRTARANNTFYTGMRHTIKAATGTASDKLEDHAVSDIEDKSPTKQKDRFFVRKLLQTTVKVRSLGL